MSSVAAIFAKNLKRIRNERQLTQAALAKQIGLTDVAIYNYEKAAQFPRSDVFDALCKALRVRPWQLLAEDGEGATLPTELVEHIAAAARACGLKVSGRS